MSHKVNFCARTENNVVRHCPLHSHVGETPIYVSQLVCWGHSHSATHISVIHSIDKTLLRDLQQMLCLLWCRRPHQGTELVRQLGKHTKQ